jgi:cytidine deaminase
MSAELITRAAESRESAIAPYSNFKVGAAIRTTDGRIFSGCNIENASYGLSVCAERVALWKALSEGARGFIEIAVVTDAVMLTPPCGPCRQLLWEYCGDITVHLHSLKGPSRKHQMHELLPYPFDRDSLAQK